MALKEDNTQRTERLAKAKAYREQKKLTETDIQISGRIAKAKAYLDQKK